MFAKNYVKIKVKRVVFVLYRIQYIMQSIR